MPHQGRGLYETIITESLESELRELRALLDDLFTVSAAAVA